MAGRHSPISPVTEIMLGATKQRGFVERKILSVILAKAGIQYFGRDSLTRPENCNTIPPALTEISSWPDGSKPS